MQAPLSLTFPDGLERFTGSLVHRAHIRAEVAAPFEVVLLVHSTDPALDPHNVIGIAAEVALEGEPHVSRIAGIVRAVRQLTSLASTGGGTASYYEVVIAPPQFASSLRFARRIHQNKDVLEIARDTLALIAGCPPPDARMARTHPRREYCVQYDETDLAFVMRVLAEDHVSSFFDPARVGGLTLADDPAHLTESLPFRVAFRPPANLEEAGPCALSIRFEDTSAIGSADLRDYSFENPRLSRTVPPALRGRAQVGPADAPFMTELEHVREDHAVGRFTDGPSGDAIASRDLLALRSGARIVECQTNFAVFPGTRFFVDDHPRLGAREELLVVGVRIVIDDGASDALAGAPRGPDHSRRAYSLRCVRTSPGFVPPRSSKPRAVGVETAFVVGAFDEGQVDVDEYGRVEVEFVWDRRDCRTGAPTRRVRVSQGWAGANRGIVTLPRIGDEVLVAYDGGDPDEPIIVGRVHNAVARTPLMLPDRDKTVSVWRSRTVGGDGFNQVLMDDKAGGERVEIRAEKTRTDLTIGDESSTVGGSYTQDVAGKETIHIGGDAEMNLDKNLDATVRGDADIHVKGCLTETVDAVTQRNAREYIVSAGAILLAASGCTIEMRDGKITIKGSEIDIEASGAVNIKGASISLK